jgi:NAD(P)-dependent dehydrogenase (short-subunit alcohol dehydrogenase family)
LVRHLGSVGAKVVVAEVNEETLATAVEELKALGADVLGVATDVMDKDSIERMVGVTVDRFGRVDGLVNNALVPTRSVELAELSEQDLDKSLRCNVKGPLWAMQSVYPYMKRAGWGRIVNVGSSAGLIGFKGMGAYGAAKEAVRSLTRTAAREWAADGIVVNCYCPVATAHHSAKAARPGHLAESMAVLASLLPTGDANAVGDPEHDLGPAVAFLLSDACRYLTGQTLTLDGGAYAFA